MTFIRIFCFVIGILFLVTALYLFIYAFANFWFGYTWELVALSFLLFITGITSMIIAVRIKKPFRYE